MVKKQYNIRIDETLLEETKAQARKEGKSATEMIENALKGYLQVLKSQKTKEGEGINGTVPVYDGDHQDADIIAYVDYNNNLDHWDGSNWSGGSMGRHKGLTKLETGEYVLIHGTDWQGERDHGITISPYRALQEILASRDLELLDKFPDLKLLAAEKLVKEK